MNKAKYVPILALALGLSLAGALLPQLIASAGDKATLGKADFAQIQSVEFELHKNIPSIGKLALMSNMESAVELLPNKASMTEQAVSDACRSALQPYIEAGLMEEYRQWQVGVRAFLVHSGNANGILWTVSIVNDREGLYCIDAVIDDETGNLLCIDVIDQQFRGSELRTEYLYTLAELFFTGLGFSERDYPAFETDELQDVGNMSHAVRYCFTDAVYGEVNVDLWVSEYGFRVEFPQTEVIAHE